jgi:hypothetical protein
MKCRMPHPFRVFQRNGWDTNKIPVYCNYLKTVLQGLKPNTFNLFLRHD